MTMRVLTLLVSRKQYTEITVTVPDGFDTKKLYHAVNEKHVARACDDLDARFEDEHGEPVEVEVVTEHKGEDAERQLKDYAHADLADFAPDLIRQMEEANAAKAASAFDGMKAAQEEAAS